MKFLRVLSRIALLLVAAAVIVGLIWMHYGGAAQPVLPEATIRHMGPAIFARYQEEIRHQPSAPNVGYVTDFVGYGILLAVCAWVGRMAFRLRLNPAPRGEGQPVLLGLLQQRLQSLRPSPDSRVSLPPVR
jgi:hypothetical protein